MKAAGGFVELLLRNQLALEHFLRAAIFAFGVEEVGGGAFDGGEFFWIGGRRIIGTDAELRAHLRHEAALAVDFKLQLLRIDQDERLAFFDVVADVGENLRDAAFDLRAQDAFFQREKRAGGLDAALGGFLRDGINVNGRGMSSVAEHAAGNGLRAAAGEDRGKGGRPCQRLQTFS